MRQVSLAWTVALLASMGGFAAESPSPVDAPPPIATRQTLFSIPFQIDRAAQPGRDPVEVQLFVSTDEGTSWQMYDRVAPQKGHFLVRAASDGQYWFRIRTLDRSGQIRPQGDDPPGLRVVIDTAVPQLDLQARRGEAGQVILQWQAADPHLDLDSLKIQCRCGPQSPWQPVAIDRRGVHASGSTRSGEAIWWPQSGSQLVEIRAEVADRAGNPAVSHAKVNLDREALAGSNPGTRAGAHLAQTAAPRPSPWRASADSARPSPHPPSFAAAPDHSGYPEMAERQSNPGLAPQPRANNGYPNDRYADVPNVAGPQTPDAGQPSPQPSARSVAVNVHPAIRNQYAAPPQANTPAARDFRAVQNQLGDNPDFPAGETELSPSESGKLSPDGPFPTAQRPRMVNTPMMALDYQIEPTGSPGTGPVQLWATRDGGRTWTSLGIDHDRQSPMVVTFPEEGVYVLRLTVESGADPGGRRPQSGDHPGTSIGVDLTKPSARILSAEQGKGDQAGRLIIRWEVEDQMLAAQPVSLFYSDRPAGPWQTIAAGLDNSGRHTWPLGPQVPQWVYLRLEARDEAGNVGTFQTPEPISIEPHGPTRPIARIRDVRPVLDSARTPPRGYRPWQ